MQGHTHELAALTTGIYITPILINQTPSITSKPKVLLVTSLILLGSAIGGLLPDADMKNSTIGQKLLPILWPVYLLRMILRVIAIIIPPFKQLTKTLGHRGVSHSPFLWILLFTPAYTLIKFPYGTNIVIAMAAGVLSHLVLDYFSGGIPLLLPFSSKRKKPFNIHIKTGGSIETAITGVITVALSIALAKFIRII